MPRVNDKRFDAATGERQRFSSAILPPWARKTPKITDVLLAFYDYRAEHWVHLRTTNPIESTFATVRHRTKITKGSSTANSSSGPARTPRLRPPEVTAARR